MGEFLKWEIFGWNMQNYETILENETILKTGRILWTGRFLLNGRFLTSFSYIQAFFERNLFRKIFLLQDKLLSR